MEKIILKIGENFNIFYFMEKHVYVYTKPVNFKYLFCYQNLVSKN